MKHQIETDFKLIKFFLQFTYKYKWRYLISFSLMPILAFLSILGPHFIKQIIDIGLVDKNTSYISQLAFAYLIITILIFIFSIIQNIFLQYAGFHSLRDIRRSLVEHILSLSRRNYDSNPSGVYVSRAAADIETISETFLQGITYLITDCLTIIAILIYIFYQNIYLGLITLIFLLVLMFSLNKFRLRLRIIFNNIREINGELTSTVNETFSMFEEVKSFNLAPLKIKSFNAQSDNYQNMALKSVKLDAWIFSILDGMFLITVGLIIFLSTFLDNFNIELSIGLFAAYILLLEKLFLPLKEMSGRLAVLQSALAAINKIYDILRLPSLQDKGITKTAMNSFQLKNITFSYTDGINVLKNINLDLPPNKSLGIIGPSGSGKSTLIKLFMRHYKICQGEFFINNIPIDDLALSAFKNKMVLIPQDPSIFSKDIAFNISLGKPNITLEKIKEVCKKLHIDEFISHLPEGYHTHLTNHGQTISTGQKQLIALARAFLSNANTVIFDEATANIDTQSEKLIQQALKVIMDTKTVITIAHRLSTIRHCDQIITLQKGRITEQGNHQQLIAQEGFYYHLLQVQNQERKS